VGDVIPKSDGGKLFTIPLFYFANANMAYFYKHWFVYYDNYTSSVLLRLYGEELFF